MCEKNTIIMECNMNMLRRSRLKHLAILIGILFLNFSVGRAFIQRTNTGKHGLSLATKFNVDFNVLLHRAPCVIPSKSVDTVEESEVHIGHESDTTTILEFLRAQKHDEALSLIQGLSGSKKVLLSSGSYALVSQEFVKQGKYDKAGIVLDVMKSTGCSACPAVLKEMINVYSKLGSIEQALASLEELKRHKVARPDARDYNSVLSLLVKKRMSQEAEMLFDSMLDQGVRPTVFTMNKLIEMSSRHQLADAEKWFALASGLDEDTCKPNIYTYSLIIKAYARANDLEKAENVLKEMKAKGVRPNEHVFTTLIDGYARAKNMTGASFWFRRMEQSGIQPDTYAFNTMIKGYTKQTPAKRGMNKALYLFHAMCQNQTTGPRPDKYTFSTLIDASAKEKNLTLSMTLFGQMAEHGVTPDAVIMNSLLKCYVSLEDLAGATGVFESMLTSGVADVYSWNTMVALAVKCKRVDRAAALVGDMAARGAPQPDRVTYSTLIAGLVRCGRPEEARRWHAEMQARGVAPGAHAWGSLVHAAARAGNPPQAADLVGEMRAAGVRPDLAVYAAVVGAWAAQPDLGAGGAGLREARAWFARLEADLGPRAADAGLYHVLVAAHVRAGEMQVALALRDRMRRQGVEPAEETARLLALVPVREVIEYSRAHPRRGGGRLPARATRRRWAGTASW